MARIIPDFRCASEADANAVAEVYLRSRKELVACAPLVHSDDSVREWVRAKLIPGGNVTVATINGVVAGFVAVSFATECSWIEHLYVLPEYLRCGIGSGLLDHARNKLKPPIRLYTFQCNEAARRFYEHHGFRPIAFGDGSTNEEKCPDILYEISDDGQS